MEETLRILVAFAFALLFVVLRSDAPRFGVAEHLEPLGCVPMAVGRRRVAWYALGLGLAAAIVLAHPRPRDELGLTAGELGPTLGLGIAGALVGAAAVAGAFALRARREGRPFPFSAATVGDPAGLLARIAALDGSPRWLAGDVVVTAIADELAFRGALLGFLVVTGLPPTIALTIQLLVYALVSRTAGPDGDRGKLFMALGLGALCGLVTLASGGVGAAVITHLAIRAAYLVGVAVEASTTATATAAG